MEINTIKFEDITNNLTESQKQNYLLKEMNKNITEEVNKNYFFLFFQNYRLKQEYASLCEKITLKEKSIFDLQAEKKINEENFNYKFLEVQRSLEEKTVECKEWEDKFTKVEKELKVKIKIYLKIYFSFKNIPQIY